MSVVPIQGQISALRAAKCVGRAVDLTVEPGSSCNTRMHGTS